ncbi:MAG TPA: T9SS type A sorting domain-containing protein [Bacteroidia bacterium]|jgi:hypothetical protein|nr:T9SS type A sorting domain-containing protein [Bacteroidia bacterium]
MKRSFLALAILSANIISAQSALFRIYPLDTEYVQTMYWGGTNRITRCADGGYYVNYQFADCNSLHTTSYCYGTELIKTDALFQSQWSIDVGHSFNQCVTFPQADTSVVAVNFGAEPYAKKLDANGNVNWFNYYRDAYPVQTSGTGAALHNSSIEFAGMISTSNMYNFIHAAGFLLDIDTAGNIVQADSITVSSFTYPGIDAIATDASGNRYIAGRDHISAGNVYVAKLLPNNSVAWCKTLSGFSYYLPGISRITPLSDGSVILGGSAMNPNVGTGSVELFHLDPNGNLLWAKELDYPSWTNGMTETAGGNILVSVDFRYFYGDTLTGLALEISPSGNQVWNKRFAPGFGFGPAMIENANSYIFPAFTVAPTVFRTDSLGNAPCYAPSLSLSLLPLAISASNSTCTLYPVTFYTIAQQHDSSRVQSYRDTCIISVITGGEAQMNNAAVTFYPNPSTGLIHFSVPSEASDLIITDMLGNVILEEKHPAKNFEVDLGSYPDGIYFARIVSENGMESGKIILAK